MMIALNGAAHRRPGRESGMAKTYYSAVVVGAVVEERIAKAFAEKCQPNDPADIVEAFIQAVAEGSLQINRKEAPNE